MISRSRMIVLGCVATVMMQAGSVAMVQGQEPKGGAKLATPTGEKPTKVEGALKEDDPIDGKLNHPSKTYILDLKAGAPYVIKMNSGDFDSFLRILDSNDRELAFDDDSGGDLNSKIVFTPPTNGKYRIVATSFNDDIGNYTLSISTFAEAKNDPTAVHKASKPFYISGKLTNNDPKDAVKNQSPCQVHQVKLDKGKTYTIDLVSASRMDPYLRVENDKNDSLAEDDDSGGNLNSRLRFSPDDSGVFRIIATNLTGMPGPYTLIIQEAGDD